MAAVKRPTFRTLATPTQPNADDGQPTSRRTDVKASEKPQRSAYTWRLTPEEANRLDELVIRLRSELGVARLDRATMLAALTALAAESPAVFGALAARLQDV
jgi:hypothetical protein